MEVTLYVSSLPDDTTAAMLTEQFEPFGELLAKIQLRKKAGLLFGFVTLGVESEEAVTRCITALHNSLWRGHRMRVERAKVNPDAERQQTFLKKFEAKTAEKEAAKQEEAKQQERVAARETTNRESNKRAPYDPEEAKERLAAAKKRKKQQQQRATEERKVRVRPVADVAKTTPWDAVLGHAWEERHENAFSLLANASGEGAAGEAERRLESVATRAFARDARRELQEQEAKAMPNPRLVSFVNKLGDKAEENESKSGASAPSSGVMLNFGEAFVRDDNEVDKLLEAWRGERHELRKDYKAKKRKSDKSSKTTQKRR